ncbi:MAG: carboxypeptidase-like regulatory domain-containing protein [Acidobacteria bacterium]|nr:carboxypeptidase-like regulatory domain-containing protein [Acidobacteriota bacterium]
MAVNRFPFLLIAALLTLGCGGGSSQSPVAPSPAPSASGGPGSTGYTLSGMVSTADGAEFRPVAGVRVYVTLPVGTAGTLDVATDENGRYTLKGLPPVICEIVVTKEGFEPIHTEAQLNQDSVMNFVLRRM